ncbi:Paraquat-inducible protein B [Klebsiella pneumoniae]|uniref:Paraquat-inducible protein B n=1 Tax=Klebsiella pneumoniae TaxID=573 RepID=A0A3S4I196_KLEPN|nr:Paraquat-inducible protein B [Klebsiella pneumoniae]
MITPQISAAGVEHLDTLFQAYINVEPGRGPARRDFEIQDTTISDSRYIDGLNIVVEAPEAGSLGIGTPVLFRGLEVGTVTGLSLGSMSDRVMVKLRISKRYQYLVRNNSVFWLASGYSLDFGLIGGVVKTGTFNQFIRGGIAFATPPGTPLAPKAQDGKHFLLQESEPKEWREWGHRFCRSNAPFSRPGQRRARGKDKPHAPVSRAGAFVLNCAPFFSVVRCPWLKILSISLKRFSLKCARRCQRISLSTTLSPPVSARYAAVFASIR